jgi:hypothetical protein
MRLLDGIDYDALVKRPKAIIGYPTSRRCTPR